MVVAAAGPRLEVVHDERLFLRRQEPLLAAQRAESPALLEIDELEHGRRGAGAGFAGEPGWAIRRKGRTR